MAKKIYLHCTLGNSDKVYNIFLDDKPNGMAYVYAENARRGDTLIPQKKMDAPDSYEKALALYTKLVKEKIKKGYVVLRELDTTDSETPSQTPMEEKLSKLVSQDIKKPILLPQLLNAIDDKDLVNYLNDNSWMAQEKKDGHRRLIIFEKGKVMGLNKKGEEIVLIDEIVKSLPKDIDIAIDGEQIGTMYHAFDILMFNKKSLREVDAQRRHEILSGIKFGKTIKVVHNAVTLEEKTALYESLKAENKEGLTFKKKSSPYQSGRPNSGGDQLKFKFQKTASFIVSGAKTGKRSVTLNLLDGDKIVNVGNCTIPLNKEFPNTGDVIEVRYLYAYKGGAIVQPVYLGKRDDVTADECLLSQLVYKSEEDDV